MNSEMVQKHRMWEKPIMIHGYRLQRTCSACPEQYDVYAGNDMIAYIRLRHGRLRVEVPDCGGDVVYVANPEGDGMFLNHERVLYLNKAIEAIQQYLINSEWHEGEEEILA